MRKAIAFAAVFGTMAAAAAVMAAFLPRPTPEGIRDGADLKGLFKPRLGSAVSPDVTFRDESGKAVRMGDFGKDRPYVLVPAYLRCPRLCNEVLNELVKCLRGIAAYTVGKDFDVVVVSFDPREKPDLAAAKRRAYADEYAGPGGTAGWHFLTGEQDQIDRLLGEVGYKVVWEERKQQYAHAAGFLICSPDGVVARYFSGLAYRPLYVRLALTEAGRGKIVPGLMDQVLLPCFSFDATKGRYSAAVLTIVKGAGVATVLLLGGLWLALSRGRRVGPVRVGGTQA